MKRHQLVQWILLPNGLTKDGFLAASVYIAPRLRPESSATLAEFPDFMDWPSVLDGLTLTLERADGATVAPAHVAVHVQHGLWAAMFPHATRVRPFEFADYADRPLISYPVREVLSYLQEQWAGLARDAREELPVTSRNASAMGPLLQGETIQGPNLADRFHWLRAVAWQGIFEGAQNETELSARLRAALNDAAQKAQELRQQHLPTTQELIRPFGPLSAPGQPADPGAAFYSLAGFHARPPVEEPKAFPTNEAEFRAELEQTHDFHHHLSALGDHPEALRRLGLVIDLTIRPDFVPYTADDDMGTRLRLRIERPSAFPPRSSSDPNAEVWNVDVTPWTECRLTEINGQTFFTAAERTDRRDFAHGFVHLDPSRFEPVAVDVDGLALKALGMATTLDRQDEVEQRPLEEPERDGIPSARTGGIALVHAGHAQDLHEDFYQARRNNDALETDPDNPPVLAAEDLVRGYRMDVLVDGTWHSLHHRHVQYTPARNPEQTFEIQDEGAVQLSLTGEAHTAASPAHRDGPLYAHEALVTWDGWSLAAPRPGEAMEQEPAPPPSTVETGSTQLAINIGAVAGTLPRLRFQAQYRLRLRMVDLAGNSHIPATADHLGHVLESTGQPQYVHVAPALPLVYRRFEPVPPPELVPRHPFGPGEGLERLVVRSTPGIGAAQYAEASQSAAVPALRFRDTCERHIAAAKASLQMVETHGFLDEALQAVRGLPPEQAIAAAQPFYDIAARESGTFRNATAAVFVPTGEHGDGQGGSTAEGYVTINADSIELPYLPDPLASGILARVALEPGQPKVELRVPFPRGAGWYDPHPLRIVLGEGDYSAALDPGGELLRVTLPAGRTGKLRLSTLFERDPDVFGIMGWCRQQLHPNDADQVYEAIQRGTHWMTTPWRDVDLLHAVQRPLQPAELHFSWDYMGGLGRISRPKGSTSGQLHGHFFFDQPSTGKLNLTASWQEMLDDPKNCYKNTDEMASSMTCEVFSLAVPEPFGTPWISEVAPLLQHVEPQVLEFHTYVDWTPEEGRQQLLDRAKAPGLSARERRHLEAGAAQLENFRAHEFGDTRYRRVTYQPSAATRYREYFDPAMPVAEGISSGTPTVVDVLSSASPIQPRVVRVLPLLDYTQSTTAEGSTISRRTGPGLRVWLDRGWFSSGAGEMLAAACTGHPINSESELSRDITLMLQDPAHASQIPQPLLAESFTNAGQVKSVPLYGVGPDLGGQPRVDLATFQPLWDEGQQAWYCDLEFNTGMAYFPFVRLGLARYQPNSIRGCELSPIVPTAFVQTVPERALTCTTQSDGTARLSLTGPAPSATRNPSGEAKEETNLVTATLEAKDPRFAHPKLGWTPIGAEMQLAPVLNGDGTATWTGSPPLPDSNGVGLRLVVREYEITSTDDGTTRRQVHGDVVTL